MSKFQYHLDTDVLLSNSKLLKEKTADFSNGNSILIKSETETVLNSDLNTPNKSSKYNPIKLNDRKNENSKLIIPLLKQKNDSLQFFHDLKRVSPVKHSSVTDEIKTPISKSKIIDDDFGNLETTKRKYQELVHSMSPFKSDEVQNKNSNDLVGRSLFQDQTMLSIPKSSRANNARIFGDIIPRPKKNFKKL
eukprot:TRINITY_DN7587_c0_g1_i1.p1 TRINITY_DN7587_c0_g1~~TRINITY_DN7587_c0_g1_i1.p1  ORF type:complete len:192 (+),score=62.61 TRINITY_DN7587_c0_g1_i1:44-619(+)